MMELDRRAFLASTTVLASLSRRTASANRSDDDPLNVRSDFPITESGHYLNTAFIGPPPKSVEKAGVEFVRAKTAAPIYLGPMLEKTDQTRRKFAELFGADADEIAFLFATTEGENIVSRAFCPAG